MNKPEVISNSATVINPNGYIENKGVTVLKLVCEEDGVMYKVGHSWHLDRDVVVTDDRLHLLCNAKDVIL